MIWQDINKGLAAEFENGVLPTMVYINRQDGGRNKVQRPLHSHDSVCEALLVYQGRGTYQANGKVYAVQEGSVIFYNQGDLHEVRSDLETEIGDYCIGITNLRRRGMKRNQLAPEGGPYVFQAGSLFPALKFLCEHMYALGDLGAQGKLAAQLLCASFIVIAGRLPLLDSVKQRRFKDEQFAGRIIEYLNERFTEDVSIKEIAAALGCSASYVSHAFKRVTGSTPMQYALRRRIGLAQTLLISTDFTAAHIATIVGYENTNYFISVFKKIVGMPPIRYREFYLGELKGVRNQS